MEVASEISLFMAGVNSKDMKKMKAFEWVRQHNGIMAHIMSVITTVQSSSTGSSSHVISFNDLFTGLFVKATKRLKDFFRLLFTPFIFLDVALTTKVNKNNNWWNYLQLEALAALIFSTWTLSISISLSVCSKANRCVGLIQVGRGAGVRQRAMSNQGDRWARRKDKEVSAQRGGPYNKTWRWMHEYSTRQRLSAFSPGQNRRIWKALSIYGSGNLLSEDEVTAQVERSVSVHQNQQLEKKLVPQSDIVQAQQSRMDGRPVATQPGCHICQQ